MIKNRGFSIIEIMLMIFVLVSIVAVFNTWQNNIRVLNSSKIYADQTHVYALSYIKYLQDNESTIVTSNITVVPYSTLINAGYVTDQNAGYVADVTPRTNLYGQTPCVIITKSANESQIFPILIFVGGKSVSSAISNRAMSSLGGYAGTFSTQDNSVVGSLGGWNYSSITDNQLSQCGGSISNNSLALNLGMMVEYNTSVSTDLSLHRTVESTLYALGDSNNSNTMLSDISITNSESSQRIYWGSGNNPSYLSKSESLNVVNAVNASVKANTLKPNLLVEAGAACTADEVGSIASQNVTHPEYEYNSSNLVCTYLPPACQVEANSNYCYLPIKNNSVIYNLSESAITTFICPGNTPIATNGVVNSYAGAEIAYYYKCNNSGTFDDCRNHKDNDYEGSGTGTIAATASVGKFISSIISANNVNYSINIGYNVTFESAPIAIPTPSDLSNCPIICTNATGKSYSHTRTVQGDSSDPICACAKNSDSYYLAIYKISTANANPIQSVTCTSKMIFNEQ